MYYFDAQILLPPPKGKYEYLLRAQHKFCCWPGLLIRSMWNLLLPPPSTSGLSPWVRWALSKYRCWNVCPGLTRDIYFIDQASNPVWKQGWIHIQLAVSFPTLDVFISSSGTPRSPVTFAELRTSAERVSVVVWLALRRHLGFPPPLTFHAFSDVSPRLCLGFNISFLIFSHLDNKDLPYKPHVPRPQGHPNWHLHWRYPNVLESMKRSLSPLPKQQTKAPLYKDWLDNNDKEVRGEGTSIQSLINTWDAHSAKVKGKKPEPLQPVADPEDEFELVMGIFEKVTHEHTEFLYQVLIYRCL